MEEIHLKEIRYCCYFNGDSIFEYLKDLDAFEADKYILVSDQEKPDYIIANETIYVYPKIRHKFIRMVKENPLAVTIFFAGECIAPDLNLFDYAVVFDRDLRCSDRLCRLPTTARFKFNEINDMTKHSALKEYNKRGFCNFIYSNGNAHPKRDGIVYLLGNYKKVDSWGGHLNNTQTKATRFAENWEEISVRLKSGYRFSIAAENAQYDGYTSEKILTSFRAHSVPIYWGNPSIEEEFNPKAFINANKYEKLEELLDYVIKIDSSPELFAELVSQPWRTKEQLERQKEEMEKFRAFFDHIFSQNIKEAKRVGQGTWPANWLIIFSSLQYNDTVKDRMNNNVLRMARWGIDVLRKFKR